MEVVWSLLPLLGAGVLSGFLAGLLGIGGGIVIIPALFIVLETFGVPMEWRMHCAVGTSLGVIVATNISSVWAHHRKGGVDWGIIKSWWFSIMIGALAGSYFAKTLNTKEMVYFFVALAVISGSKMLFPIDKVRLGEHLPTGLFKYLNPAIIGFLSAIKGIGGGSYSVPYMTLYSIPIHRAIGTASLAGIFISVFGGLGYLLGGMGVEGLPGNMVGFIHVPSLIAISLTAVLFAPAGAKAAHAIPKNILSIVFGVFLLAATLRLVLSI